MLLPRLFSVSLTGAFTRVNGLLWRRGLEKLQSLSYSLDGMDLIVNSESSVSTQHAHNAVYTGPLHSVKDVYEYWGGPRATPTQRVVYVSFGEMVVLQVGQYKKIVQALAAGMAAYDYEIVWAVPALHTGVVDGLANLPAYVTVVVVNSAGDENRVFAEKNVLVTVGPCESELVGQSVTFGVPLVCVPFYGEQYDYAKMVVEKQIGVKTMLDVDEIAEGVAKLVTEEEWKSRADIERKRLLGLGGSVKACEFIEEVLAGRGRKRVEGRRHVENGFDALGVWFACVALFSAVVSISCGLVGDRWRSGEVGGEKEAAEGAVEETVEVSDAASEKANEERERAEEKKG